MSTERTQKIFPLFALAFVLGVLFGLLVTLPDFLALKRELQKTVDYIANQKAGETWLLDLSPASSAVVTSQSSTDLTIGISPSGQLQHVTLAPLWVIPGKVVPHTMNDVPTARYAWLTRDNKLSDWKLVEKFK